MPSFCPRVAAQNGLHTGRFTRRTVYTQNGLHTERFTHRTVYTQNGLNTERFTAGLALFSLASFCKVKTHIDVREGGGPDEEATTRGALFAGV
jgi:hypothetical protein